MACAPLVVVACGGFLLAVLYMDLMFDIQVLRHGEPQLPEAVLEPIAAYYRRVTTDARPLSHVIGGVMLTLLVTLGVELAQHPGSWLSWLSVALCAVPVTLALLRVYPNAVRLGARTDGVLHQSVLARGICRDHLLCLAAIVSLVTLRLFAAPGVHHWP